MDVTAGEQLVLDGVPGPRRRARPRLGAADLDEVAKADLPDAFVAAMDDDLNVPAALAVVHVLWERGLRVPDDVAVAGFDDVGPSPPLPPWMVRSRARRMAVMDLKTNELVNDHQVGSRGTSPKAPFEEALYYTYRGKIYRYDLV
ncbi:substrate-binding domain-containing protein, partial [Flavobacterium chungangensis]